MNASIGLKELVEGVEIGNAKQDLSSLSVDFVKSTPVVPVCTKILVGKVCTMLTVSEIISTLSGDFKSSKTYLLTCFGFQLSEAKWLPKRDH